MRQFFCKIFRLAPAILLLAVILLNSVVAEAAPREKLNNRPYADLKRMHLGFSVGMHFQDLNFTHNGYLTLDWQTWVAQVPSS